jgi:hypothetical protein
MTYRQDRKMAFKFKVKEEADRLKPVEEGSAFKEKVEGKR